MTLLINILIIIFFIGLAVAAVFLNYERTNYYKETNKNMIKDLQTKLLKMGNFGCLCMCYLFMIDIDPEELVTNYDKLVDKGIIDEDCFVRDGDAFIAFFGSRKKVLPTSVDNKQYDKYIACFQLGEKTHFVVVDKNDNIIYNPYYQSICAKEGKIVGKRTLV